MAIKIMIIEDDLIIAENLKENLFELGYGVTGVAQNYLEALELYSSIKPDLCLVDIYLRGSAKNGIETIADLNAGFQIPIIYLTSFSDLEFREKAKATNPSSYLIKPASKEQIDVSIDMAMNSFYKNNILTQSSKQNIISQEISMDNDIFYVKVNKRYEKIILKQIIYLKASGTYCEIYLPDKTITVAANLKSMLSQLNDKRLVKSHRSYAINIEHVEAISDISVFVSGQIKSYEIPLSNTFKKSFLANIRKVKTD